ncbi:type II secretion system protein GspM [Roseovarius salis]|uniref:type II secretion system protein GspM n=1 Tax=Roseovarius salis TaxID=3376063 RepID=UPI0037C68E80
MISALSDMLVARSRRERWLMALLVLVALPFGYVYGVVLPLNAQYERVQAELEDAVALERWLLERRAELESLPPLPENSPGESNGTRPVPGLGGIEERLRAAGLDDSLDQLASAEGEGIELKLDDAIFTDLMRWLDALESETGYRVERLALQRADRPGRVEADMLLRPR